MLFSGTLSQRRRFRAALLRFNVGLASTRVLINGKPYPLSGSPTGFEVTRKTRKVLPTRPAAVLIVAQNSAASLGASRPRCAYARGVATRPARGPLDEAALQQVGLVDVLDRVLLLAHGHRQRGEADRPATELRADRVEDVAVQAVEAEVVDLQQGQRSVGGVGVDDPRPRTSAKSRTRLSSRLATRGVPRERARDRRCPALVQRAAQDRRAAVNDRGEVVRLVGLEAVLDAEAVAQRRGQQAGAGRGPDECERRQIERDDPRPCPRPTVIGSWRSSIAG